VQRQDSQRVRCSERHPSEPPSLPEDVKCVPVQRPRPRRGRASQDPSQREREDPGESETVQV